MKPVVVTGAGGFVGRHVASALREATEVIGLSRSKTPPPDAVSVRAYADFTPPPGATLIHLGEPPLVSPADAERHQGAMVEQCRALLAHPWGSVIYGSSAAVYGDRHAFPRQTDEAIEPRGVYAESKAACERLVLAAGGDAVRLSNVFGRGMSRSTLIFDILSQIGRAGPLRLRNSGSVRDFLFVEDAGRAFASIAKLGSRGSIFNVGSGKGYSALALAELAVTAAGEASREIVSAEPPTSDSHLVVSIDETSRRTSWRPALDIEAWMPREIDEELRSWRVK